MPPKDTRNAKAKAAAKAPAVRSGVSGNPAIHEGASGCTDAVVGVVESINEVEGPGKKKYAVKISIGADEVISVVTPWTNVRVGGLVAVAVVGSYCDDVEVKAATVGTIDTQGKLLDSPSIGWGGTAGEAALLPSACKPGDAVPSERPKRASAVADALGNTADCAEAVESLFVSKVKISKEDKAAAKKAKLKAKKLANGETVDDEEDELVEAPKAELKKCKKRAADKRKAGEDCTTDDELDAAGFLAQ
ncbi:hypothetical protein M885DRAFT_542443 [Pelagophyceae sp. CCMP2097]|nr:hypothetical protein M885DRAFT_542443 [Pelagophyceae sp. CCMP2097]|mmetsp:Transcript_15132/g.50831  ORF Transcript_15132/g.50831 Transcript_15132/m.50831 type:complete len:248 (+) Transcript_15132:70-813(+)